MAVCCRNHAEEFGGSVGERERFLSKTLPPDVEVIELPGAVSDLSVQGQVAHAMRAVRRWRPEVVHAHTSQDPRLVTILWRYPSALTVHDPTPHPGAPTVGLARRLVRRAGVRAADLLIVHGHELKREMQFSEPRRPVAVLNHGTEVKATPAVRPAELVVLLLGRLERYKGISVLQDAMTRVWAVRPEVRLVIAGEGPAAAEVLTDPRITTRLGYIAEADIEPLLTQASLVALPYVQASQSGIGLRAIGEGVPCVVSNVGSLADLVHDRSLVVPAGDAFSLAEAILRHIDHDHGFRELLLEHARAHFDWTTISLRALELYSEVLSTKASRS